MSNGLKPEPGAPWLPKWRGSTNSVVRPLAIFVLSMLAGMIAYALA